MCHSYFLFYIVYLNYLFYRVINSRTRPTIREWEEWNDKQHFATRVSSSVVCSVFCGASKIKIWREISKSILYLEKIIRFVSLEGFLVIFEANIIIPNITVIDSEEGREIFIYTSLRFKQGHF